jgi:pectate lyase
MRSAASVFNGQAVRSMALMTATVLGFACSATSEPSGSGSGGSAQAGQRATGGTAQAGGAASTSGGAFGTGGAAATTGGVLGTGGASASGGASSADAGTSGGASTTGGGSANGGAAQGGAGIGGASGGTGGTGGKAAGGATTAGTTGTGGATGPTGDTKLDGLLGFATVSGYGLQTTTGAGRAPVVRVSNFADFAAAVKDSSPRIVEVSGTIQGSGAAMVDVGSNKTILGVGASATLSGFGLDINGWTEAQVSEFGKDVCGPEHIDAFPRVQNVIVRNLTFTNAADDAVNIQCYSHHVWVDHNTFQAGYDGSLDIKRGSDLVTVSWNRFVSTDKTMLLGHSADNGAQDRGFLRATYHHNWFDNTNTRTPRVRFGFAHVFNNYLNSTDYFLGLGIDAKVYAEGNFVEKAKTLTQTFTESTGYHVTWAASNQYDQATITRANDSGSTMSEWLDADGSVQAPRDYPYTVDGAGSLATSVKGGAGIGKL